MMNQTTEVVVVGGGPAPALAATGASSTIPIVLAIGFDPVQLGFVAKPQSAGRKCDGRDFHLLQAGSQAA